MTPSSASSEISWYVAVTVPSAGLVEVYTPNGKLLVVSCEDCKRKAGLQASTDTEEVRPEYPDWASCDILCR